MRPVSHWRLATSCVAFLVAVLAGRALGQGGAATDQTAPSDLRPLLAPRHSELRLAVTRYTADRTLLGGNYAGNSGRGANGGRGGGAAPGARAGGGGAGSADSLALPPITISTAKIARLKRFDLDWQSAITRLDPAKLSPAARADRDTLLTTIQKNLAQLDVDGAALADAMPLLPFAPTMVGVLEDRIHLVTLDAEGAARTLTALTQAIADMRARLDSSRRADTGALHATRVQALRAAGAVETLRDNLATWHGFYNGYDPLFMWWMALPYKHIDAGLKGYAAFLRDTLAVGTGDAPRAATPIPPSPPPKINEVPDLAELMALPQDEMTDIVARFMGRGAGGGRGNGGGGGGRGGAGGPVRDAKFYTDWLAALTTLDFDHLTRNAQVDYLYLKKYSEMHLKRVGVTLSANPPRKTDNTGIPGAARGRDGLVQDLEDELIPYSPEQLIALAEREFAWCDKEMLKASHEMGYGDNWKGGLKKTKTMHVAPGAQPAMIRDLIFQAIDYLRAKDLVTVPEVVSESQRMVMMTPEQQLSSPFFLGGTQIQVSYPTDGMEFDAQEQSMRGNNEPWSHATAFHEMVPGHNLAAYYQGRFGGYRAPLGASGPFYTEGWAVYWELTLYDKGFDTTPEERVGALFWRMHRCARIIFSLKFHMGEWSPREAIDFLVARVGHEPDNATAEVRRSFQGGYGPLYQAGYLLGALQLRGLRHELVDSKQMTEKAFHDEILRQGNMPISLIRLALTKQKLTRDMSIDWKFYGDLPEK